MVTMEKSPDRLRQCLKIPVVQALVGRDIFRYPLNRIGCGSIVFLSARFQV